MNDRFKFRVFYKPHNKIYNVICLNSDRQKEIIIEYKGSTALVEWKNCDILQCTGLKDKNSKLIYEGDILGGIYYGYIEYCNECKCFQLKVKDYGCLACEGDLHWYELVEAEEQNELEVIGNIYENKELLE